jgi:ectoine hydroxylase-related dioxygenase (phytanoyl-CoA dioxygenase family)
MGQSQNVAISDDVINEFHENGVALIRGLFGPWVDGVREAIEENKLNPSWRERTYKPENKNESEFFQDYCVWNNFAGYRALVMESPMAKIAAQLMRSKTAKIFHDHVLVKEPGNSVKTPWHHDQPYYIVDGQQSVSFWVPLDVVPSGAEHRIYSQGRIIGVRTLSQSVLMVLTYTQKMAAEPVPENRRLPRLVQYQILGN